MKKFAFLVAVGAFAVSSIAAQAADTAVAMKGRMLYGAGGSRLGAITRVTQDGSAQIIIDGKLVTVPASSISTAEGKIATTLTKNEVIATR